MLLVRQHGPPVYPFSIHREPISFEPMSKRSCVKQRCHFLITCFQVIDSNAWPIINRARKPANERV
jgi:hypothetical protein